MQYYMIVIKNELPKIITSGSYETIKRQLFKKQKWIEISNELYDNFEFVKIKKIDWWETYLKLLENESEYVKDKIKNMVLNYKKKVTKSVIINMINSIKN